MNNVLGELVIYNTKDKTKPNSPDMHGKVTFPDGTELPIALWKNSLPTVTGGFYFSGKINEAYKPKSESGEVSQ